MLFNSFEYLVFFPTVILLFFLTPHRARWFVLLSASYFFYGSWRVEYLALIIISTIIDYISARQIAKSTNKRRRRSFLFLSLFVNLGLLMTFKYLGFFTDIANDLAHLIGWNYSIETLNLLLPVGISFYTFQTLSYTIDVYNGKVKPENHLGIFAVYVSFFPQLVAGPIERPGNLLPQFHKKQFYIHENVREGLTLIAWGLFKKVVIADRAAMAVNAVYNNLGDYSGLSMILATIFFAFQIYGDFSGYSDIAIGSAKVMGFDLSRNFNRPYFSKNISEFWKRWHITLSSWFKDYVYIPLGGNRVVKWRWYYNLFVTFLISGLWHGAAWTFVIWGALHGIYLIVSIITEKYRNRIKKGLRIKPKSAIDKIWQVTVTFVLVNIGWVFFRANSLDDAWHVLTNLTTNLRADISELFSFESAASLVDMATNEFVILLSAISIMLAVHFFTRGKIKPWRSVGNLPIYIRWPVYYALILAIVFFGVFDSSEFIYFQF